MTQTTFPKGESARKGLQAVHKQWALWTIRKFRFIHPEWIMTLYGTDWKFTIYVANCDDESFATSTKYFNDSVRPATCHISLSQQIPLVGTLIEEVGNYEAEIWLNGEPLSVAAFNNLMSLAESALPDGEIDYDNVQDTWVFRSFIPLTDDEKSCVQKAANKVGLIGPVDFTVLSPPDATPPSPVANSDRQGNLDLITSRHLKHAPDTLRDLVHQDEDEWREFLSGRANQETVVPDSADPSKSACLYDVEHCGDSRLSELLTLYERIDITPDKHSFEWFGETPGSVAGFAGAGASEKDTDHPASLSSGLSLKTYRGGSRGRPIRNRAFACVSGKDYSARSEKGAVPLRTTNCRSARGDPFCHVSDRHR